MIERGLVAQRLKEFQIQEYIRENLKHVGHSHTKVQRTPLGEKIIIFASRPGLIVGKKGASIKKLTVVLKKKFHLENPQIEISEVTNPDLDAHIVSERIANSLEKFGSQRFKGVGHKTMEGVMNAGALGVEIIVSGKIPSARARSWRFYAGYLKKCGDVAISDVRESITAAHLKSGTVGIRVRIMPPDIELPDTIKILSEPIELVEEIVEEESSKKKKSAKRKTTKKGASRKKKTASKEETKTKDVKEESAKKNKSQKKVE